ncbi:MAG: urease subunit beta [Candidatus Dasytiphilus stammeri]
MESNKEKSLKFKVPIGGYVLSKKLIYFNENKLSVRLTVINSGDRAIQVGSHYHFFEVNKMLKFDRTIAYGKRLNIIAGTAIRFEPGEEIEVSLIPIEGKKLIYGFNNLVDGWVGKF